MKTVTIEVTKEDIKKGIAYDGCYCPIARALKRKFIFNTVKVNEGQILIKNKNKIIYNKLMTNQIRKFVSDFDGNNKPKPFKFKIQLK